MGATSEATCQSCMSGTYLGSSGNVVVTDCVPCMAGKFSPVVAATGPQVCQDCVAGKYAATSGNARALDCLACMAGKYLDTIGNDEESDCIYCMPGTYSSTPGTDSCDACAAGTYSMDAGEKLCELENIGPSRAFLHVYCVDHMPRSDSFCIHAHSVYDVSGMSHEIHLATIQHVS